jgi:hypothetical protein
LRAACVNSKLDRWGWIMENLPLKNLASEVGHSIFRQVFRTTASYF